MTAGDRRWLFRCAVVAATAFGVRAYDTFAFAPLSDFDGAGHVLHTWAWYEGHTPHPGSWSGYHPDHRVEQHWTPRGNRVLADALEAYLRSELGGFLARTH